MKVLAALTIPAASSWYMASSSLGEPLLGMELTPTFFTRIPASSHTAVQTASPIPPVYEGQVTGSVGHSVWGSYRVSWAFCVGKLQGQWGILCGKLQGQWGILCGKLQGQ